MTQSEAELERILEIFKDWVGALLVVLLTGRAGG